VSQNMGVQRVKRVKWFQVQLNIEADRTLSHSINPLKKQVYIGMSKSADRISTCFKKIVCIAEPKVSIWKCADH